jgi:hypothetical protein
MIETYFNYFNAATLARLPSGATEALIEGFASSLHQSGFAESTARRHLRAAAHVCAWLTMRKIAFESLDEESLDGFAAHLGSCRCFWRVRGALHPVGALWSEPGSHIPARPGRHPRGAGRKGPGDHCPIC